MEENNSGLHEEKNTEPLEHHNSDSGKVNLSFKSWIKWLEWQDYVAVLITLLVTAVYLSLANSFVHIPSPVFGGDYYRDRGFVNNIVEGNSIWSDGFYVNEIQYYPYLIFVIQAGIVKITGLSVDQVFIYFPILTTLLTGLVWYLLGKAIFKSKNGGLLTLTSLFAVKYSYGLKSSDFGLFVIIPLFLYLWLRYEQTSERKYALMSGTVLGVLSLIHGGRFLASISLIGVAIIILLITDMYKTKEWKKRLILVKNYFKKYYLIFLIAIIISLIFFMPLYFKYKMHSVNNVTIWGDTNIELLGLSWVIVIFKSLFFNLLNFPLFVASILAFLGITLLLFNKKNFEQKWVMIISLANLLIIQHHLITIPLLNTYFNPGKLELITYFFPLYFTFGALFLIQKMEIILKKINKRYLLCGIIIILLLPSFYLKFENQQSDRWEKYGQEKNEYLSALYGLADYLTINMNNNETVLSNDESGFMLAVLSGRKVMLTRRTHASYYVDIDQRIAEASVAMYGQNRNETMRVLDKYRVKYFYVDQNLFTTPMRVRIDLKKYLNENKINFTQVYDRYDIALPLEETNGMDLLLIPPQTISSQFLDLWEKVYEVRVGKQVVGELYQIRVHS